MKVRTQRLAILRMIIIPMLKYIKSVQREMKGVTQVATGAQVS